MMIHHFIALFLLAQPAPQITNSFTEDGVLRILRDGKEVGRETFKISREGGALKATAEIRLTGLPGPPVSISTHLEMDAGGGFKSYRALRKDRGVEKELLVSLQQRVAICEEKSAGRSASVPVVVEPGFQVLDTNVFHHFALLGLQLASATPPTRIPVLIPQETVSGQLQVEFGGKEMIKPAKEKIQAKRFNLDSGQVKLILWLDDAGRLQRISVPQSKAEVIRIQ